MSLALVTGASRGIGRAVALGLAESGYDVIVHSRSSSRGSIQVTEEVRKLGRKSYTCHFDVSSGSSVEQALTELVEAYGCPAVLVNNAGILKDGLFARLSRESWDVVMDTNLGSFYSVTRPVLRHMMRARSGRIINIASVSGERGNAGQVNYAASKAGLIGATKALALEVASRGITVNAVSPGFIDTDMVSQASTEKVLPFIPMGRIGTPEEVAGAVTFLASDIAGYITGQVLSVNGGLYT